MTVRPASEIEAVPVIVTPSAASEALMYPSPETGLTVRSGAVKSAVALLLNVAVLPAPSVAVTAIATLPCGNACKSAAGT
ncbi:hypothetical protein SRABI106_04512 [Rahnella aquatilis]|nr:hypothetical protein SRABI106_04512 [Rahnella aquatilis]